MKKLNDLLNKAKVSSFYLWLLNRVLWRMIPFNSPHKFLITKVENDRISIRMPYKRVNMNHIKGLHACGLATLCEYTCGLQLMNSLGAENYRIIMQKMEVEYLYQGKGDVQSDFLIDKKYIEDQLFNPLITNDSVLAKFKVLVKDKSEKEICRADITWQIKPWSKVRTKV